MKRVRKSRGQRGTYVIDIVIAKRRYRFATGATKKRDVRDYRTMVKALRIKGRIDLLDGLIDGLYTAPELMTAFRTDSFERLPRAEDLGALQPKWEQWAEQNSRGKTARYTWEYLTTCKGIRDLPRAVQAMREVLGEKRAFALYRNEVICFLRDTVSRAHPMYAAVAAIAVPKRKRRELGRPLGVEEVRTLLVGGLDPEAARIFWTMCATGAGVKELWTDGLEVLPDRIAIHGQKRVQRDRVVPRWTAITVEPRLSEPQMRRAMKGTGVMLYDGRRTFARWCEDAGITRSHIESYMGHKGNMTSLYQRGELPGQLADDGAKLAAFAGAAVPRFDETMLRLA